MVGFVASCKDFPNNSNSATFFFFLHHKQKHFSVVEDMEMMSTSVVSADTTYGPGRVRSVREHRCCCRGPSLGHLQVVLCPHTMPPHLGPDTTHIVQGRTKSTTVFSLAFTFEVLSLVLYIWDPLE